MNNFNPDYSSPPGDTLRDLLEERGIPQTYLAFATGFSAKHINQVIQGNARISVNLALALERELGVPAQFWLHRQVDADLFMAKAYQHE